MTDYDSLREVLTGEKPDVDFDEATKEMFQRWLHEAYVKQQELEATIKELKAACEMVLTKLADSKQDLRVFCLLQNDINQIRAAIKKAEGK